MKAGRPTILLVNPWITDFAAYDLWIKPLGLLMVADMLTQAGCRCDLLDCLDRFDPFFRERYRDRALSFRADGTGHYPKIRIAKPACVSHVPRYYSRYGWPRDLVEKRLWRTAEPDAVFVTSGMTYWYQGVHETIGLVKSVFPGVPVILGGIYASLFPAHARRGSGADMVLPGRAEDMLPDLVRTLFGISMTPAEEMVSVPAWDLYPVLDSAVVLTSRGCPYRCPFCASGLLYPGFVQRDTGTVVEEITRLSLERNVGNIAFADDALLHRKEHHLLPLLDEIVSRRLPVSFHTPNGLQPGKIDQTAADLMKAAGFSTIQLSFESSDPSRQAAMQYKVRNPELAAAVEHLFAAGFTPSQIRSYVLMGLPDQAPEEVIQSILYVFSLGIQVNLASFSPIPGTACWPADWTGDGDEQRALDPLLTNNSIFPLARDGNVRAGYRQLRSAVSLLNAAVRRGEPLLHLPDLLNEFRSLSS
ncbi:cobalamin-dependent protein [bacterium]|nr:cobalamin-dependent protein [bacterium]